MTQFFIEGNEKTKREVIIRELDVVIGGVYTIQELKDKKIPRSISNLKNIDLFNRIDIDFEFAPVDSFMFKGKPIANGALRIKVVEKWYLWPIPFVEYADRNINEWFKSGLDPARTNYGLYLFKYNLFGKNQTLKFHFVHGFNRAYGFEYRVPWLWGRPHVGLEVKSGVRLNREVWYKTENNELQFFQDLDQRLISRFESMAMINIRPGVYNWHRPYIAHTYVQLADTVASAELNPEFLGDGRTRLGCVKVGYQWLHEHRNNKCLPTGGNFKLVDVGLAALSSNLVYPYLQAEIGSLDPFKWSAGSRWSTGWYAGFRYRMSTDLPYEHQRSLGYERYMRGYEPYVVDGNFFGMVKSELRFHLINERYFNLPLMPLRNYKSMPVESFLSLFCDQGYVNNPMSGYRNSLTNSYMVGYGVGLNTLFYLDKVLRFEYSFNAEGEGGFRFHFHQSI